MPETPPTISDRPLRVLHVLLEAAPGGVSRYIIDLANALAPMGVESIVAADDGLWRDRIDSATLQFVQIPLRKEKFLFTECVRLIRLATQNKPIDVIHTHYRKATLLGRKLQRSYPPSGTCKFVEWDRSFKVPVLYTVHLTHMNMKWWRGWMTDFGDITHIASEDARDWCVGVGKVPEKQIRYIPHGVDVERFHAPDPVERELARSQLQLKPGDTVAAFVGRLDYPKNEHWLIDLAAVSKAQLPSLKILLAGDGPNMAALRHRIDAENLHDRVRLLGEIDPVPLYHAADALLLPSIREGFSLVCAEAMSCGLPVLRTRTTGSHETVVEGITGYSCAIDHDAFILSAMNFLGNRAKLAEMGAAAAAHIRTSYTHAMQAQRTYELYCSLSDPKFDAIRRS